MTSGGRTGEDLTSGVPAGEVAAGEIATGHAAWLGLEALHAAIYFAPEAFAQYQALGITHPAPSYFAPRAAALGPVGGDLVAALFYVFNPAMVRRSLPAAWATAAPEALLAARLTGADRMLRRLLGPELDGEAVLEAAGLARTAAEALRGHGGGRALYAAHSALPWPSEPHLVLWHAQTLLREFRGDGHVAALLTHELDAVQALVLSAATDRGEAEALRLTRGWSEQEWANGVQQLTDRGVLAADGALTDAGRRLYDAVEALTRRLAVTGYAALGVAGSERLAELGAVLSRPLRKAQAVPVAITGGRSLDR